MKRSMTVVYIAAQEDELLRQKLERHLTLLEQQGLMQGWHIQQIPAGSVQVESRNAALQNASLVLLLISADFFASSVCQEQMQRALERQRRGKVQVIPVLVRRVDGKGALFAHLQALPRNGKPITSWPNEDEAFAEVAEGIRVVLEEAWTHVVQSIRQLLSSGEILPSLETKVGEPTSTAKFYYCYISEAKVAQILHEGKLDDAEVIINAKKFREGVSDLSKAVNEKFENGGEYGKPGTLGFSPEESKNLVKKLFASLAILEEKYSNIDNLTNLLQERRAISPGVYLYRGIFGVSKYDERFSYLASPLTSGATLLLTCSLKYFSEVRSAGGKLVLSSSNALFFSGEVSVELQCLLYVLQIENNRILGTPLFLGLPLESFVQL